MNLKEFYKKYYQEGKPEYVVNNVIMLYSSKVTPDMLKDFRSCEEFKNVKDLEIIQPNSIGIALYRVNSETVFLENIKVCSLEVTDGAIMMRLINSIASKASPFETDSCRPMERFQLKGIKEKTKEEIEEQDRIIAKKKVELEAALATLTREEKEFGLYNRLPYLSVENIKKLKATYETATAFTFWEKVKAGFELVFKNTLNDKVVTKALKEINAKYRKDGDIAIDPMGNASWAEPINKNGENYESLVKSLEERLKETEVKEGDKTEVKESDLSGLKTDSVFSYKTSDRMAEELDKSIKSLSKKTSSSTSRKKKVPVKKKLIKKPKKRK